MAAMEDLLRGCETIRQNPRLQELFRALDTFRPENTDFPAMISYYEHHYRYFFGEMEDLEHFLCWYALNHIDEGNLTNYLVMIKHLEEMELVVGIYYAFYNLAFRAPVSVIIIITIIIGEVFIHCCKIKAGRSKNSACRERGAAGTSWNQPTTTPYSSGDPCCRAGSSRRRRSGDPCCRAGSSRRRRRRSGDPCCRAGSSRRRRRRSGDPCCRAGSSRRGRSGDPCCRAGSSRRGSRGDPCCCCCGGTTGPYKKGQESHHKAVSENLAFHQKSPQGWMLPSTSPCSLVCFIIVVRGWRGRGVGEGRAGKRCG
ncbi:hypothetical protein XENTR_v10014125 [Xenopus tropicalis]|nr:hypothetical protein XENTR_v10014125 [Xenopus tropicalis]